MASMVLVGDARGKVAILVDDMADTCGTIVQVPQSYLRSSSSCHLCWQHLTHAAISLVIVVSVSEVLVLVSARMARSRPLPAQLTINTRKKTWTLILPFSIDKHCLQAAQKLVEDGATKIYAILTHGIFRWSLIWFELFGNLQTT